MNLESKLEFLRSQYLALCYLSFYSKLCHVSSAMGHPLSSYMLMTQGSLLKLNIEFRMKLIEWKTYLEAKGLIINTRKTKIMVTRVDLQTLKDSAKYPCSVCRKGVGSNFIYCSQCLHWVHKKFSGLNSRLNLNPHYRCSRCKGTADTIDGRP